MDEHRTKMHQIIAEIVGLPADDDFFAQAGFSILTGVFDHISGYLASMTGNNPSVEEMCVTLADPSSGLLEDRTALPKNRPHRDFRVRENPGVSTTTKGETVCSNLLSNLNGLPITLVSHGWCNRVMSLHYGTTMRDNLKSLSQQTFRPLIRPSDHIEEKTAIY